MALTPRAAARVLALLLLSSISVAQRADARTMPAAHQAFARASSQVRAKRLGLRFATREAAARNSGEPLL